MYIECGHPSWSSVPYLIETFAPDVRIIHLVRHPVPTAWSWLTHRAFCTPLLPHLPEKALYYWLEVNTFGRIHSRSAGEWLTLSFDEMFDPAVQRRVLSFVTASEIDAEKKSPGQVDELRSLVEIEVEPMEIAGHPEVLRLATDLGFDPMRFDAERLRRRYAAV
jgi:hypothetical protein